MAPIPVSITAVGVREQADGKIVTRRAKDGESKSAYSRRYPALEVSSEDLDAR